MQVERLWQVIFVFFRKLIFAFLLTNLWHFVQTRVSVFENVKPGSGLDFGFCRTLVLSDFVSEPLWF